MRFKLKKYPEQGHSWLVETCNGKPTIFSKYPIEDYYLPSRYPRGLAHDCLEHIHNTEVDNPFIDELIALGSMLGKGREYFIGGRLSYDEFPELVAINLIDLPGSLLFSSYSPEVEEWVNDVEEEIVKSIKSEKIGVDWNLQIKRVVITSLSRGYQRVKTINDRFGHFAFYNVVQDLEDTFSNFLLDDDYIDEIEISTNFKTQEVRIIYE